VRCPEFCSFVTNFFGAENSSESNMYTLSNWLRGDEELDMQPQSRLLRLRDSLSDLVTKALRPSRIAEAKSLILEAE